MDSIEYVAKRSTNFLCTNRLHSGKGVRLKYDAGDIHLMGQNDAIFQRWLQLRQGGSMLGGACLVLL